MTELIGIEYKALVNDLESRLDEIVQGKNVPRVVILEAPSGSGKSRIIRELYERLRANPKYRNETSQGDCYWPTLESDVYIEDGLHSGFQHRKELGPTLANFFRPPHALPGFMWQTIRCDLLAGKVNGSVLEIISPQIQAHFPYLAHAIHTHKSAKERAKSAFGQILNLGEWEDIRDASIGEGILKVFEKLEILQGVPFVSWGIDRGIEAFRLSREQISRRKDVANGGDLGTALTSAESIYRNLMSGVHKKIPLILAIEDIHLIDDEVAALIAGLAEQIKDKPVLVVGTAWPESKSRDSYVALLESLGCEDGIGNDRIEIIAEAAQVTRFPRLTPKENSRFVTFYAPKTSASTAIEIASLFENPFAIKLSMSSRLVQSHISDQALSLRKSDLVKIPKTVEDIYRARWKEIAAPVREVLLSATATFPQNSLSSGELHFFMSDVLVEALFQWNQSKHAKRNTEEALSRATDPLRWIKSVDSAPPFTFQFKEWILQRVAHDELSQEWPEKDIADFRQAAIQVVQNKILKPFEGKPIEAEKFFDVSDSRGRRFARYFLGLIDGQKGIKFSKAAEQISRVSLGYAALTERRKQECINQLRKVNFNPKTLTNDFMWNLKYEYDSLLTDLWPSPRHLEKLRQSADNLIDFHGFEKWPYLGYLNTIGMTELKLRRPRQALNTWSKLRPLVVKLTSQKNDYYFKLIGNMMIAYVAMGDFRSARQHLKQLFIIKSRNLDLFGNYESTLLQWDWVLNHNSTSYLMAVDLMKNEVQRTEALRGPSSSEAIIAKNDLVAFQFDKNDDSAEVGEFRKLVDLATQNNKQDKEYFGHLLLHNYSIALERALRSGSREDTHALEFERASAKAYAFALEHQNRESHNFANALSTRIDQLVYLKNFPLAEKFLRLERELASSADDDGQSELMYLLHYSNVLGAKALTTDGPSNLLSEARAICEELYPRFADDRRTSKILVQNIITYSERLSDKKSLLKWYRVAVKLTIPEIEVTDYFTYTHKKIVNLCDLNMYGAAIKEIHSSVTLASSLYSNNKIEVFDWYQTSIDLLSKLHDYRGAFELSEKMRILLESRDYKGLGKVRLANGWSRIYEASGDYGDYRSASSAADQVVSIVRGDKNAFTALSLLRAKFNQLSLIDARQALPTNPRQFRSILRQLEDIDTKDLWWPEAAKFYAAGAEFSHKARLNAFLKLAPSESSTADTKNYFIDMKVNFVAHELHGSGSTSDAISHLEQRLESDLVTIDGSIVLLLTLGFFCGINGDTSKGFRALKAAKNIIVSKEQPKGKRRWELEICHAFLQTRAGNDASGLDKLSSLRRLLENKFYKGSWHVMLTFEMEFFVYALAGKPQKARKILNHMCERFDGHVLSHSYIAQLEKYIDLA